MEQQYPASCIALVTGAVSNNTPAWNDEQPGPPFNHNITLRSVFESSSILSFGTKNQNINSPCLLAPEVSSSSSSIMPLVSNGIKPEYIVPSNCSNDGSTELNSSISTKYSDISFSCGIPPGVDFVVVVVVLLLLPLELVDLLGDDDDDNESTPPPPPNLAPSPPPPRAFVEVVVVAAVAALIVVVSAMIV